MGAALNSENALTCYLLPGKIQRYTKWWFLLSVRILCRSGINLLTRKFVGALTINFIPDLESEILK